MSRASATKAIPLAERRFAEHHAAGAILVWPAPPLVRVGAWGTEPAPAATGQITAMVNGTPLVRFPKADGTTSEPMELVAGQACRLGRGLALRRGHGVALSQALAERAEAIFTKATP